MKKTKKEELTESLNNLSQERINEIWEKIGIKDGNLDSIWKEIVNEVNETGRIKVEMPPDDFFYDEDELPDWM